MSVRFQKYAFILSRNTNFGADELVTTPSVPAASPEACIGSLCCEYVVLTVHSST